MKVALIGASGRAGSRLLAELTRRGHAVVAMARHAGAIAPAAGANVSIRAVDANDPTALAAALKGCEAAISAAKFRSSSGPSLIDAVKQAGVRRLLVVGGAGSLLLPDGTREMDSPRFPPTVLPEAAAGAALLALLQSTSDLDWTYLSPSRLFEPGGRTGTFRMGADQLLMDPSGRSAISMEDYAIAMVDELEQPRHLRQRFTVGY